MGSGDDHAPRPAAGPVDSRQTRPLAIVGPTASGKSALALAVAELVDDVELISVDSMQVYRGMDIGTASPTAAQRTAVPHHLVDIVEPDVEYTVGAFQHHARAAIADVRARGRVPVLVGGTGLYLRALTDDLHIPGRFPDVRAELESVNDTTALHDRLTGLDPLAASRMEPTNRRRVLRALEVTVGSGRPFSEHGPGLGDYPATPFVQVALRWSREELDARIGARYERQMAAGFLEEVQVLAALGPSRSAAQALGYRELLGHVRGECSLDEALAAAVARTRRFARRQERWFRRDPRIIWVDAPSTAAEIVMIWDERRATPVG